MLHIYQLILNNLFILLIYTVLIWIKIYYLNIRLFAVNWKTVRRTTYRDLICFSVSDEYIKTDLNMLIKKTWGGKPGLKIYKTYTIVCEISLVRILKEDHSFIFFRINNVSWTLFFDYWRCTKQNTNILKS